MKNNNIIIIVAVVLGAGACRTEEPAYATIKEIHFPGGSWEPAGLAVRPDGSLLATDISPNAAIQLFDPHGIYLGGVGGAGEEAGYLWVPMDVALGVNNVIYVAEFGTHRVTTFRPDGAYIKTVGAENLKTPMGVAVAADGGIYVADPSAGGLVIFDAAGKILTVWGEDRGVAKAWDVAVAPDGKVAVVIADGGDVPIFNPKGGLTARATTFGGAWEPIEATYDRYGRLYIVGRRKTPEGALEPRVAIFNADGRFKESFAVDLTEPSGIAVGPDGKIYIGDGSRHDILVYGKTARGASAARR